MKRTLIFANLVLSVLLCSQVNAATSHPVAEKAVKKCAGIFNGLQPDEIELVLSVNELFYGERIFLYSLNKCIVPEINAELNTSYTSQQLLTGLRTREVLSLSGFSLVRRISEKLNQL